MSTVNISTSDVITRGEALWDDSGRASMIHIKVKNKTTLTSEAKQFDFVNNVVVRATPVTSKTVIPEGVTLRTS